LERNVKAVLCRVDNKDPLVEDFSNKYVGLNLHNHDLYSIFIFSSPCQRQCELLPSLGVRRPLTFHILIFSSSGQMKLMLI
jgi:hypothetical protein